MKPSKIAATVVLFFFALQLAGCTTTKLLKPDQKPHRLKSKKIEVITSESVYLFSEIRVYADTLFGVYGVPFPPDRHSPQVISVPYASIQSIHYRGTNWSLIGSVVAVSVVVAAVVVMLALSTVDVQFAP